VTIEWHNPKNRLPEDGDVCLLMAPARGPLTASVYGPIHWHAQSGLWLDIFRTAEAGEAVHPDRVALWTLWDPIEPSDVDEETTWPRTRSAEQLIRRVEAILRSDET
jgi:hypothetical protein